jgi:protease IV
MACEKCGQVKCEKCNLAVPEKKSFISRHKVLLAVLTVLFIFVGIPFFLLIALLGAIGSQVSSQPNPTNVISGYGDDRIALINVSGIIMDSDAPGGLGGLSEEISSEKRFRKVLQEVERDPQVKSLIIKVNSPGGSAAASEQMYQDILDYKKTTKNKVLVYYSDIAASGGYYISMAADQIIANPQAITGSIGVIIEYLNLGDLAQKYGVQPVVYKSGAHKDIISQFRNPTEEERQIMQGLISDSYDNFVLAVAKGRNLPESEVLRLADGRVYSAKQAKEEKLIDGLGSFEDAVSRTRELAGLKQATVVEYGQQTFFETLLGSTVGRINLTLLPNNPLQTQTSPRLLYLYAP